MSKICVCTVAALAAVVAATTAVASPIGGTTYTYDLSQPDPATQILTTPHPDADDTASLSVLNDGDLGSLVLDGSVVFSNGTYAGFRNDGFGGAPQPKIDIDLNGTYLLDSVTLYALIEPPSFIFSPQPQTGIDSLTASVSTDGVNFSPAGFSNDFPALDFGDPTYVASATINLGGVAASHLSLDVRTPYTFIFLSEFVVDGRPVPEAASATLAALGGLGTLALRRHRRGSRAG